MTRAAHDEILRLTRLRQGADLSLMLLAEHSPPTAEDAGKRLELEQRRQQLLDCIAWFEGILSEHESAAE